MGIAVSRVNNYLHGKYRTIRPDHLGLLVGAAARTPAERLELVRAYLTDLLPGDLQTEVAIGAAGGAGRISGKARSERASFREAPARRWRGWRPWARAAPRHGPGWSGSRTFWAKPTGFERLAPRLVAFVAKARADSSEQE
jgi:hypothetical protein